MLKIGTKLGLGIGTLLAVCVIIGLVSYSQTRAVGRKVKEITEVREPVNSAVNALENNLVETAFGALGYLSTGDQKLLDGFNKSKRDFDEIWKKYIEVADDDKDGETGRRLQERFTRFHAVALEQIWLRDWQTDKMRTLLEDLDAINRLLSDNIQASIKSDDPLAYRRLQAALEMEVQSNAITNGLGNFLLTRQPQYESRVYAAERKFKGFFQVYQVVTLSAEEKRWAEELHRLSDESFQLARVIVSLEKQRMQGTSEFTAMHRDLGSVLDDRIQTRTAKSLAEAKEDVLQAGSAANARILFVLLFGVVFGIAAGVVTTKNITGPLRQLASVMNAIAHGDRARRVDIKSSDELHSLGEAFNLMTGELVQANEGLRAEIAERARVEEALRASEERFRLSIESVKDYAIFMLDPRGNVASWNAGAERMKGYSAHEILGVHFSIFYPGEDRAAGKPDDELKRAQTDGRFEDDGWRVRKDGSRFWANVVITAIRDEDGLLRGFSKVTRDVTEQKRLQEQLDDTRHRRSADLRRFVLSVQRAQEEERKRFSRELHDDLCQRLSGMKFRVEVLEDEVRPLNKRAIHRLRDVKEELDRSIIEVRRISSNLRPSVLDDFGLVTALKLLCKEFEKLHKIKATLQMDDPVPTRMDSNIEIALYRIAQEALANVAKHASASSVIVRLARRDSSVQLTVKDDGKGFTQDATTHARGSNHGLGLISMRERSELLGGSFAIDSTCARGLAIIVTLPLGEASTYEKSENSDC